MKHLLKILFVGFLVMSVSTGFTLHYHYCCGQLQSVGLFSPPEPCCGDESDCCHDESESFQLESDFLISDFSIEAFELQFDNSARLFNCYYEFNFTPSFRQIIKIIDPMPPANIKSHQVLFQSFLI